MINNTYYNITYNGSLVVHKICRMLRKSNYYKLAARYMEFNIISLNHNLIISTGKYLLWRVKNFVECAKANADSKDYEKSLEIINKGIERVELLKTIEEQDPPLLDADQRKLYH